jgi:hypothetical protein
MREVYPVGGLCRNLIASLHKGGETSIVLNASVESRLIRCSVGAEDRHRVINDRMKEVAAEDLILAAR